MRTDRTLAIALGAWFVAAASVGAGAAPAVSSIRIVSTNDSEVKANHASLTPSVSFDGNLVAFESLGTDLDPSDTDRVMDIYLKNLGDHDLSLVSTTASGVKGNLDSYVPSMSVDGTKVAFESYARNFDSRDRDTEPDIYVKDRSTGALTLASTNLAGTKGNLGSYIPSISADGTAVAFYSDSTNFAQGVFGRQVWVKNLLTGALSLASSTATGVPGNGDSYDPVLSADGSTVAFFTYASNLAQNDTDTATDIYVKDIATGALTLVSTSSVGVKGNNHSQSPSLSADGNQVAFWSYATNLDQADTDSFQDVYIKNLATGALALVSTTATGVKGNRDTLNPEISSDGVRVAFESFATNFDTRDTDGGIPDIYVKNVVSGELDLLSTSTTGIKGTRTSDAPAISGNGLTVAFDSQSNLVLLDRDRTPDVYARTLS